MSQRSNWNDCHTDWVETDDTVSPWHVFIKTNVNVKRDITDKRILEIGCGRGGVSKYLSALEPKAKIIYGCDFSERAIQIAKERYGDINYIEWRQEDIMNQSFESDSFDTAFSLETIEHVPDPKKALEELYRVLKKDGRLYLTCPNYFNLVGLWCIYRKAIGNPYTEGGQPLVKYLLLPQLFKWFNDIGFKIELFYTGGIVLPFPPFHFYKERNPLVFKHWGLHAFFILKK
jgi:SAM-dependent methyltransferase